MEISFTSILGWIFTPFAWLMGVPSQDCAVMGLMLGEKVVLTELLAYFHLSELVANGEISYRTQILASYALCGFANFASVGIQIGGIGALAPQKKATLAKFGFKALIGGTLASLFTAVIVGVLM